MRQAWLTCVLAALVACGKGSVTEPGEVDAGARDATAGERDTGPREDAGDPDAGDPDAGPTGEVGLCETCSVSGECEVDAVCGPLSDGALVCLKRCTFEFNDCPRGFECAMYAPLDFDTVCLPVGAVCCVDEDADGYGVGAQCEGPDCDDDDIARHPDAPELCNGADEDCDSTVDEEYTDCELAGCEAVGSGEFQDFGDEGCADGACVGVEPSSCGLYTCELGGDLGEVCAVRCDDEGADSDALCVPMAHCEGGGCEADLPNGSVCDEDSDCGSNHCDNGYCCDAGGTCCAESMDCPGFPGEGVVCDVAEDCEGSRGMVQCNTESFACETISGVPDDTACDDEVLASDCGLFADLYCDGTEDQPRPRCPTSCSADDECDDAAHCDASFCFPDLPDGEPCDEASDCVSGYCENGFCCASGDCCRTAVDCPGSYGSPAVCDDMRACAGTRDAASCVDNICGTNVDVPDDSACTSAIVADECGLYPAVRCTGAVDQSSPVCPTMCAGDSDCDESAHCDAMMCEADLPNGSACDEASDCQSGICNNGFCCTGGDCCARDSDCPSSYAEPSTCLIPSQCQGQRRDAICNPTLFRCETGALIDDDSGCAGIQSNDCGLFPGVACDSAMTQPTDQAGRCDTMCVSNDECDPGAFCNAMGRCEAEGEMGDPCGAPDECTDGLSCVDGVCCTSACTGACEACNVAGSEGSCAPVPDGTDPAGECGAIDCGGYFAGFSGDVCYERDDAPASAVDCNGARACETASEVCPMQGQGAIRDTCDAQCENPASGTCTGTTGPTCTPLDLGNETCGLGVCRVSSPICVGGARNTCTPGSAGTESCNDLDDDCNGQVDDGLPVGAHEPNNGCGEVIELMSVTTDGASGNRTASTDALLYPNGDVDFYRVYVDEDGGADCIFTCVDRERSTLDVTIEVPVGAGSFELCGVRNSCGDLSSTSNCVTVTGGSSGSIEVRGDSHCCSGIFCNSDNSENFYLRVRGVGDPAFECNSYELTWTGDEAC